jgi:hypothetical protein
MSLEGSPPPPPDADGPQIPPVPPVIPQPPNPGSPRPKAEVDFAPTDLLDGRKKGHWQTRYPDADAQKAISFEKWYLCGCLAAVPVSLLILYGIRAYNPFELGGKHDALILGTSAWIGGMAGGTLFSLKWLYHSVAQYIWNIDRRLWRLFTPHLSGALGFFFVTIVSSGIFRLFDASVLSGLKANLAVGFLVGYFSDTALAKLTEVAQTLFGATKDRASHVRGHPKSEDGGSTHEPHQPNP